MQHLTQSQKRYLKKFQQFVDLKSLTIFNDEFKRDVNKIRSMPKEELSPDVIEDRRDEDPLTDFMKKYRFPANMYNFVITYLEHNTIEPHMLEEGIYIVSDRDKTAIPRVMFGDYDVSWSAYQSSSNDDFLGRRNYELKIVISPFVTTNEIIEYIRANKDFIKEKQALAFDETEKVERIRLRPNQIMYDEILSLHEDGMKSSAIAKLINDKYKKHMTDAEINVAINRAKERKNNI